MDKVHYRDNPMEKALETYKRIREKILSYTYMMVIMGWDSATEAPNGCFEKRGMAQGIIADDMFELETSSEYVDAINVLFKNVEILEPILKHEIIETKKRMEKQLLIPKEEYVEFSKLMAISESIWAKAKNADDFQLFLPVLEKVVTYNQKYVKWLESDELKGYDILLDEYESGFSTKEYDAFFELLKEKLVPFVLKITSLKTQNNDEFATYNYPKNQQVELTKYLEDVLCFDRNFGVSKESEHPFTSGFGTFDVRYTNHFHETNFISSIYSAIHELGHATYELQCDPALNFTNVSGGASMAMHESQSRFYENMIGRDEAFIKTHFAKFKEIYPTQFMHVEADDLYKLVNKVENSLIRTEADELTYPLHIMLRYDLEKALLSNELKPKDLPQAWNAKMKEYFDIEVPSNQLGCLQDVHWSGGMLGYFPTYALGSAYAAQIYHAMNKDINIKAEIETKTTKKINAWLKDHIHTYGASKYPKEILRLATKEDFNPNYYIDYLIKKYSKIYNISN